MQADSLLTLAQWSTLRIDLAWAYRGAPFVPVVHGRETSTIAVWLLLAGSVVVQGERSGRASASAGQWIVNAQDKDGHHFSTDAQIVSLRFKAHWPNDEPLFDLSSPRVFSADVHPKLLGAAQKLVKFCGSKEQAVGLLQTRVDVQTMTHLRSLLMQWLEVFAGAMLQLGAILNAHQPQDARVTEALRMIETLPLNHASHDRALAKSQGLSVSQLNRLFVESLGMTPRGVTERRRFDAARAQLLNSTVPIKQLAFSLGFRQPSHFSNWFHKRTGIYPSAYRLRSTYDSARLLG